MHKYQQHCYGFSSNIIQLVSLKLNVANQSSMLHEHFHLICTYLDCNIIMATTAILYCYKKCFPKAQLDKYEQFYFMHIYRHTYKITTLPWLVKILLSYILNWMTISVWLQQQYDM